MSPFQAFRLWSRRAPGAERVSAALATALVVAVLGYVLVPSASSDSSSALGQAQTTGDNASVQPGVATGQSRPGTGSGTSAVPGQSAPVPGRPATAGALGAGGTTATGTTTTAAGAAHGCTAPPASGPGISSSQIKIAVTLAEMVGPAGNQTFAIPATSEQEKKYDAVAKALNAAGGLACRQLVLQYYKVNPADQSDMHQKCLDIVQSGAFGVIDDGGEALAPDCFGQNKIPYISSNLLFAESASRYYPYLMSPFGLYNNAYRNMIFGLKARGFFDPAHGFKKLGFMYFNCVPELINQINGWLHQAGLPDSALVTFNAGCPSPPLANPSDIEQAILKFKSSGVTNVTFADFMGSTGTFTSAAQQQNFHPKYGIADDGYIGVSGGTSKPDPNNFNGAIAITPARFGEEHTPGLTPSSGTARCDAIFRSQGVPPVYQQSYPSNGGFVCDMVWMLQAAVRHTTSLTRAALAPGLQAAKTIDFSYPVGPDDFTETNGTAGGEYWRAIQYVSGCSCWKVVDATFHRSR